MVHYTPLTYFVPLDNFAIIYRDVTFVAHCGDVLYPALRIIMDHSLSLHQHSCLLVIKDFQLQTATKSRDIYFQVISEDPLHLHHLPSFWLKSRCLWQQICFVLSLVEIWSVVLEKNIFKNFVNVFSLFCNYFPLENGGALYQNKIESSLPKNAFCQLFMKFPQTVLEKIFKFRQYILALSLLSPLRKGQCPYF